MEPFKLRVLMALTDVLGEITVANGYSHDLEGKVYRGRLVLFDKEDPVPVITILEMPLFPENLDTDEGRALSSGDHPFIVQGFAADDHTHPTDPAYRLLADVRRRIAQEKVRGGGFDILGFGSRISKLDIGPAVVRPPEAGVSTNCYFWMKVTLRFSEDHENPFA